MVKADPRLTYFAPLIGILAGAVLGWFIVFANEHTQGTASVHTYQSWAAKFMAVVTACSLWSLVTLPMQKKSLYGGGMIDRNDASARRDGLITLGLLVLWVASAVAFTAHLYLFFYALTIIYAMLLFSETGWNDPFWIRTFLDEQTS